MGVDEVITATTSAIREAQIDNLNLEIWAAQQNSGVLAAALKRNIKVQHLKNSASI